MRELESRFPDQIAVVGVHSGKYTAERETSRIRDASIRLGAVHPTINDRQFRLWRAYAVRAWPTLVAIDPRGFVVGTQAGEFTADRIAPFAERVIAEARSVGALVEGRLHFAPDAPTSQSRTLAFPGKVAVDGRRIAIADSGHHRVLVGTLDDAGTTMRVDRVIGGPSAGYADGAVPAFRYPQGLAFSGDLLFVADAGNHSVREVTLATGVVRTLAGTGRQLRSAVDEAQGALSSPWDVAVADDTLYVAMAGIHQLWTVELSSGTAEVFSGSGAEELHDGPHASAALAQPMGLCLSDDAIWFVDAESSAVRVADRDPSGGVRTLVGTGLFDFGDIDGTGDAVRMQHQQGIARTSDGRLLVCDSYDDALKWVDPTTRRAETWVRGFHEPSGLAIAERAVYVADTNAHRIAVVNRRSGEVWPLIIEHG
ncbi:MAG: alkyl hydroperoxide reductase/Thiol specific antioxidant/Mal allergen [Gemmatimonadetes bacterium]|nr:alkyl hydroperoxide reductase/Thiol specific antioxidant/Mal allergen [Gemmatimonadota bacterium]